MVKKERKKAAGERIITTVTGELAAIKQPIKSKFLHLQGKPPTYTMCSETPFREEKRSS